MSNEDKLIAAIDRNTAQLKEIASSGFTRNLILVSAYAFLVVNIGCPRAKSAPLVSDGDEIASVGTAQVITPHPSWAAPLAQKGILPDVIKGWFIVVSCMRLLRCVYGDDMATVIALRQRVLDDVEQWQKLEAMTPAELKAYLAELRQEAHDAE